SPCSEGSADAIGLRAFHGQSGIGPGGCNAGRAEILSRGGRRMTQLTVSRRRFVQATAASSLALAGIGFGRIGSAQAAKPNIVFILADDLGYADVSCYGQRDYTTPNVDRLANEGLRFTQGYSNSANCSPTRTALITGRYQMRLEVGL